MENQKYMITPDTAEFSIAFDGDETEKIVDLSPAVQRVDNAAFVLFQGYAIIPDWDNIVSLDIKFREKKHPSIILGNEDMALAQNGTRELTFPANKIPISSDVEMILTLSGAPGGTEKSIVFVLKISSSQWDATASHGGGGGGDIEDGTANGQVIFWDNVSGTWQHTEIDEFFWDDTNKRLGVKSATPGAVLEVVGDIISELLKLVSGAKVLKLDPAARSIGSESNDDFFLFSFNQPRMTIKNDGKIGIGTTAPGAFFHVEKSTYVGNIMTYIHNPTGGGGGICMKIETEGGNIGEALLVQNDGSGPGIRIDSSPGDTEPFVVDDDGNVGVGTASPSAKLDINGSLEGKRIASAVNVSSDDEIIIGITDTSAPRTVTLASADVSNGRIIIIKDEFGGAGTNNITISAEDARTIDGSATAVISSDYGAIRLYSDGSNWFTF